MAVRLVSKFFTGSEYGLDDLFTVILFATGIASLVLTIRGTVLNGLGKDIWTLSADHITNFLYDFYFLTIVYFVQVVLLKLTLLFFYLRIFPGPGIRRYIWATVIFNVLFGIASVLVTIFACTPISYFWHSWDGEHKGTCISINHLGWANAGLSISLDLWMLGLPMSQLVGLRLHWKKKVGVAMMFVVGTLYVFASNSSYFAPICLLDSGDSPLTTSQRHRNIYSPPPVPCPVRQNPKPNLGQPRGFTMVLP